MDPFYESIPGWFSFRPAYDALVAALPERAPSLFVELGLWQGRSSAYLGTLIVNSGKPISYVGVDAFVGESVCPVEDLETVCRANLAPLALALGERFQLVTGDSAHAAHAFADESVDVVWIDADHEKTAVLRDIDAWWPKLRRNGVMGGDDWAFPGVQAAVKERFKDWAQPGEKPWPWWWVRKNALGKPEPV